MSHRNLINDAFFVGETIRLTAADRVCIPVSLYHCSGMVLGTLACVANGSTMVLPSEGFEPRAVVETVQKEGCNALYRVPTMLNAVSITSSSGAMTSRASAPASWDF